MLILLFCYEWARASLHRHSVAVAGRMAASWFSPLLRTTGKDIALHYIHPPFATLRSLRETFPRETFPHETFPHETFPHTFLCTGYIPANSYFRRSILTFRIHITESTMAQTEMLNNLPVVLFEQQKDWEQWLEKYHDSSPGLWMKIAKKASGVQSVSYAEALDSALCHGWIDGQRKSYGDAVYLQKFTPRRPKSIWSKINREKVLKLMEQKRMKPAGLLAVESAQADGRWQAAYDSYSRAEVPADLQAELDKNTRAQEFFSTLNKTNKYAIIFRIQTAKKADTRAKRIEQLIAMLENNEKLHP